MDVSDKKWIDKAVFISALKVSGVVTEDNTELSTTHATRISEPPDALKRELLSRVHAKNEMASLSKTYEGGHIDYTQIEGTPHHLSTLASMLVPNAPGLVYRMKYVALYIHV